MEPVEPLDPVNRIARDTAIACAVLAVAFWLWKRNLTSPLGVLGGGLLIGLSFWAIRGTVDTMISLGPGAPRRGGGTANVVGGDAAKGGETGRNFTGFALVKFFTRHGIVALAAYGMMVRLHLDPVGLIAGVSSLGVAVGVEALRDLRWRRFL
jgi:hypothetical protein